jgi:hypothetical protein
MVAEKTVKVLVKLSSLAIQPKPWPVEERGPDPASPVSGFKFQFVSF